MTHEHYPDTHHDTYSKTVFGFWIYLLTDFVLFGALFATYAVLRSNTFSGPNAKELFLLPQVFLQSILLLIASFTIGLASASTHRLDKKKMLIFSTLTLCLGIAFTFLQCDEFYRLLDQGYSWKKSAFLSAYFTLVGTHTLHLAFAILWTLFLVIPTFFYGITPPFIRRMTCLKMFWQFLNVVWVFIFTFVYLTGGL